MSWMRREFLRRWGSGVTAASLPGLLGCANRKQTATPLKENAALITSVADLEKRIPQLMTELRVPGTSISIVSGGRIAWRRSFGIRDHASGAPVDDDTIFEAQSMSKPVFAYRVLKLAEQGVLDLDAPLTKYAPELFLQGDSRLELITARRVLSHTAGFPNWRTREDPLRINFTPGEKWSYFAKQTAR
jgi:CubicO group peptidase (beta-lactamase class C family)